MYLSSTSFGFILLFKLPKLLFIFNLADMPESYRGILNLLQ